MRGKKGAELATRKLVVIAIVAFVIIIVILAASSAIRNAFLSWVKGMPEYKYEYDIEIDPSQWTDVQKASLCPVMFGKIEADVAKYVWVIPVTSRYISINGKKTMLLWEADGKIVLDELINQEVGYVKDRKIYIYNKWFNDDTRKWHSTIPNKYSLRLLDGAYKVSYLFCRMNPIVELKQGQAINMNNLPVNWGTPAESGNLLLFADDFNDVISIEKSTGKVAKMVDSTGKQLDGVFVEIKPGEKK